MKRQPENTLMGIRYKHKLTQQQMSLMLGVSNSMVKLIETNRRKMSKKILLKLAEIEIQLSAIQQRSFSLSGNRVIDPDGNTHELMGNIDDTLIN